jgi:hypothetical protein
MSLGKEDLIRIITVLNTLHDETASFFNMRGLDPTPESRASKELAAFRTESVLTAYTQGNLLIEVSADQLIALFRSLTEPVLTIAPWTSVRAIMESSALASWLLDPGIIARERVQRSFAFRYEGLTQQVKFARASGLDTSKAAARIDDVEKLALSFGFLRIEDAKGRRIGIGQQFPKVTDLIGSVLNEEANYRLLSAFTHAHSWAIQQLSFSKSQESNPEDMVFRRNTTYFEKALQPEAVVFLCHRAAYAFAKPIWYKAQLYGYELPEFIKMLNNVFDSLRFSTTSRFWNG